MFHAAGDDVDELLGRWECSTFPCVQAPQVGQVFCLGRSGMPPVRAGDAELLSASCPPSLAGECGMASGGAFFRRSELDTGRLRRETCPPGTKGLQGAGGSSHRLRERFYQRCISRDKLLVGLKLMLPSACFSSVSPSFSQPIVAIPRVPPPRRKRLFRRAKLSSLFQSTAPPSYEKLGFIPSWRGLAKAAAWVPVAIFVHDHGFTMLAVTGR